MLGKYIMGIYGYATIPNFYIGDTKVELVGDNGSVVIKQRERDRPLSGELDPAASGDVCVSTQREVLGADSFVVTSEARSGASSHVRISGAFGLSSISTSTGLLSGDSTIREIEPSGEGESTFAANPRIRSGESSLEVTDGN